MDQRYLLVCSITTGRQFPERKNSRLIIEGKFKDEILESDPVPLHSSPQINTGNFTFYRLLQVSSNFMLLRYSKISHLLEQILMRRIDMKNSFDSTKTATNLLYMFY